MARSITAALEAHFGQDLTTIAVCWKIERRDGTILGFTNHDETITYDGVDYDPFSSANLTNLEQLSGSEADNMEIEIAFDSSYITKEDIQKGKYDHAAMHVFMINYADTTMGIVKLVSGHLGEAELTEHGGKAELVSLSESLQNKIGRIYTYKCDAQLGDTRCKVVLSGYQVSGTATGVASRSVFTDSSRAEAAGYFKYGYVTFTSGSNNGWTREVKSFSAGQFSLLFPFPFDIQAGDAYTAVPGCDKYPETCKDKFSNFVNYRGCPHLPGRDEIVKYPDAH